MPPSVANQPGKSPETAPQTPKLQLSPEEQARLNLEAQQKIEIARAAHEQAEAKAKAVEASGAKRADVIAAPLATPSTPATTPAATPTPAPDKPFSDKIKDFFGDAFGKFKDFFDSLSTKFSSFFDKLFKKKEALAATPSPSNTPAPAPGSSPASPPAPETPPTRAQLQSKPGHVEAGHTYASLPERPANADETWGLQGPPLLNHPKFKARASEIAGKIGVSLEALYAIIKLESYGDPYIVNRSSRATGLIQWIPSTAESPQIGTTVEKLRHMSGLQQLDYVEKFFKPYFGKMRSFADLYRAVFFPASIGKPADYIFKTKSQSAELIAKQNPAIAKASNRPDGLIDNAGFERYANAGFQRYGDGKAFASASNQPIA
jgi:hypothetical protein